MCPATLQDLIKIVNCFAKNYQHLKRGQNAQHYIEIWFFYERKLIYACQTAKKLGKPCIDDVYIYMIYLFKYSNFNVEDELPFGLPITKQICEINHERLKKIDFSRELGTGCTWT